MKGLSKRWLAVLAIVFALGFGLRVYHLGSAPPDLKTADEYAWTWAGMSLIATGVPTAWSYLDAYPNGQRVDFHGQRFNIVSPWLDHPPLFPLLMGGWARLTGSHDPYRLSLATLRVVPLALWTVAFVLLVFALARTFEPGVIVVAMVVFAVSPPAVLQSKLVVAENLLVPMTLAAYLCLLRYCDRGGRWAKSGVVGCTLVLPLIKIAALSLSAFLVVTALRRRRHKLALVLVGASAIGIALFFVYGAHYGFAQFLRVQQAQSHRFVGFNSGLVLLISTHIVNEGVIYPAYLLAGVAMVIDAVQDRLDDLYLLAFVYVTCMTFFADQRSVYGWYWLPLYPALAAGIASFTQRMWRADQPLFHALWAVMMLPWALNPIVELRFDNRQSVRLFYALTMLGGGAVILFMRQCRRLALRAMTGLLVGLQLAGDLYFLFRR